MSVIYVPGVSRPDTLALRMAREGWIIHPTRGRIRFHARTFQRRLWQDTSRRRVICKARQVGMSQAVGAEAVDRAMRTVCKILMISRNDEQAQQLLGYCKGIYYGLEYHESDLIRENTRRMVFANGSEIVSLPANAGTGRGYAATHVYFDEAAWAMYATQIWQSIAPTIATGGTITVLSSPNGPGNLFAEICGGERGRVKVYDGVPAPPGVWSFHHITWRDNPEYTTENPNWFAEERPNYGDDQWASEFEASLSGSGERVFDREKLDEMIEGWLGEDSPEVVYLDKDNEFWYVPPQSGHLYVSASDLGRKHDPFVCITLDVTEDVHHLVAFERYNKLDWDVQEERMITRMCTYPGWNVMDASGLGDPVWQGLTLAGYNFIPFVFSRTSKPDMVDELVRSTNYGILKQGLEAIYREMDQYRRKDEKLKQDTVMAIGMGEYISRHLDLEQTYTDDDRVEDVSRGFGIDREEEGSWRQPSLTR